MPMLAAVILGIAVFAPGGMAQAETAPLTQPLALEGAAVQGGLMVGRTEPGARVFLDGKALRVAPDGRFLVGFGRGAAPRARLRAVLGKGRLGKGRKVETTLSVRQRQYQTQRINGLPPAQVSPDKADLKRIRADSALIKAVRKRVTKTPLFRGAFQWPVVGVFSGVYGSRRVLNGAPRAPHLGVDIAAPLGTPVVAPADGVVALAQDDMFFTGKTVMLDHGLGLTSVFAHMSRISVRVGQSVVRGQVIGAVGATGRATGPHLHWGVHLDGVGLDPALLAGPMPAPPEDRQAHREAHGGADTGAGTGAGGGAVP